MVAWLTGCPADTTPTLPPTTNGGGFIIETHFTINGITVIEPHTQTYWQWTVDGVGAKGNANPFYAETNELGLYAATYGRVPAQWTASWISSLNPYATGCNTLSSTITVNNRGELVDLNCILTTSGTVSILSSGGFSFTPNPFNTAAPPLSISIQGQGLISTYGMPVIQYFDMNGNLVSQQSASAVSSDGTILTASTPPLIELPSGIYAGIVSNIAADGSYQYAGTASVDVPEPFYRPTTYSDMGVTDPSDGWTQTITPQGPIEGGPLGSTTTAVTAYSSWDIDQNGNLSYISTGSGSCTWSGFPSYVSPTDLTLYIPYSTALGGPPGNTGYYVITAIINGTATQLFATDTPANGNGILSLRIPAGTNLSSIQVTASVSPEDQNPGGNTGAITNYLSLDVYVQ
jgi:hypothetical protein